MSEDKRAVYDPTDVQLEHLGNFHPEMLSADDLSSPELVTLIIASWRVSLHEVKVLKNQNQDLRAKLENAYEEKADLRVELAKTQSDSENKSRTGWIEIPVSFISGFAINVLSSNPSNGVGWFMLLMSLLILLALRMGDIKSMLISKVAEGDAGGGKDGK